jgi:anti-sigma regulatory factor (Ser/Thr protein kinase)
VAVNERPDPGSTAHSALLYRTPTRFVEGVASFVREGLQAGDRVLAAVTHEKVDWLREELGSDTDAVDFADATTMYERPGPMFATMMDYIGRHAPLGEGRVRIVAEQALSIRDPADVRAYMRYEAASNLAYGRFGSSVLCPYDAERLPEEILHAALRTHPQVIENSRPSRSHLFTEPRSFVRQYVRDRPAPIGTAPFRLERPEDIAGARALVRAQARAHGLAGQAVEDLSVGVSEVATNALIHGGAPRRLWSYVEDGHLVCQVRDAGSGLPDPLAGYFAPDPGRLGGCGLWVAHQLCDVVEIASSTTHTNVYLHMRLPTAA